MSKFIKFLPMFVGLTVTSGWMITVSDAEVASIGDPLVNIGYSILNLVIKFAPQLLIFGAIIAIVVFISRRMWHRW